MEANKLDLRPIFIIWRYQSEQFIKKKKKFKVKGEIKVKVHKISYKEGIKIQVPILKKRINL